MIYDSKERFMYTGLKSTAIKYFGGKSYLKTKLKDYVPAHTTRLSRFFGAGSFELSLEPNGTREVYNDIYKVLVNFYRVLQSKDLFEKFARLVELTPFADFEFEKSKLQLEFTHFSEEFGMDSIELAWAFFVSNRLSRGGSGQDFATPTKRLRRNINENVSAYLSAVDGLYDLHERIRYCELRSMDFRSFIEKYDTEDAWMYLDPPYLKETRVAGEYLYEMSEADHIELLELLKDVKCKFMLSGYDNPIYDDYSNRLGWTKAEFEVSKSSSSSKTKPKANEVIWMNY